MQRSRILRQVLVHSGLVMSSLSEGMVIGQLSGMIAALQSDESDMAISEEVISWIASTSVAASLIGLGLAALVSTRYGRGNSITIFTIPIIVTWIMLYYSNSATVFIISRALVGVFSGGILAMLFVTTGEYVSSKKRPLCLYIIINIAPTCGMALSHILCIIFHWRTVALISIVPPAISSVLAYFWVESPSWLASKGRFEESEIAFRELHGYSESADAELNLLINLEKSKQSNHCKEDENCKTILYTYLVLFTKKSFWSLFFLSVATMVYKTAAGKYLFITFAISMLQDFTASYDILYFTVVVDGLFLLGTCISCFLISRIKMRTLLFSASGISIVLLILLSACIYFQFKLFISFAWTKCILLALYLISINAGPYPVLDSLVAEMYPLEMKGYYIFLFGFVATAAVFLNLKLALFMINDLGYHGIFLLNTFFVVCSLIYMWFRLPETKGRTLQEIEIFFENNTFEKIDKIKEENNQNETLTLMDSEQEDNIHSL